MVRLLAVYSLRVRFDHDEFEKLVFVGDSVTFGINLGNESLFTELMQANQSEYDVYN